MITTWWWVKEFIHYISGVVSGEFPLRQVIGDEREIRRAGSFLGLISEGTGESRCSHVIVAMGQSPTLLGAVAGDTVAAMTRAA